MAARLFLCAIRVIFCLFVFAKVGTSDLNCGISSSGIPPPSHDRVLNGHNISAGDHPWLVAIGNAGKGEFTENCGGTIISDRWILTAGHCNLYLNLSSGEFQIMYGSVDRNDKDAIQRSVKIKRGISHPEYQAGKGLDIALVELVKPINFSALVQPVCLPKKYEEVRHSQAIVCGWGAYYSPGDVGPPGSETHPIIAQEMIVPIDDVEECKKAANWSRFGNPPNKEYDICAGGRNRGTEDGDSGGPLLVNNDGRWWQIGAVSRGQYLGTEWHNVTDVGSMMKLLRYCTAIILFCCLFDAINGKRKLKILVNNPAFGWSHMQFNGRLVDLLVEAGHEVHMLVQEISPLVGNYTGNTNNNVTVIRVPTLPQTRDNFLKIDFIGNAFSGVNNMLLDGSYHMLTKIWTDACGEFLDNHQPLIERMREEKYDVAVSEFIHRCQFGIFHKIGVHTKLATSTFMVDSYQVSHFGLQPMSSYVPNLWAPSINAPYMGFYERARNLFMDIYQFKLMWWLHPKTEQDHFTRVYGQNFPSISDILKNVSLAFFNTNEFLDLPRPISNKIVYIGGVVEGKAKNLTQDFQQIMDKSKKGVVLFSFGSVADTKLLDPKIKEAFFKSFASFSEYEFIWKLELIANETWMKSIAPNVHLFDWFDQRSILAHPKTVAFITHCGMNSLNEGARAGVPLIGIPLFSDQLYDAAAMKHKKFGVYVDILEAHKQEVITSALDQVLNNPIYSYNAKLIQKKLNNAPFSPAERFVKWLEFAAEFPNLNELQLPSPDEIGFFAYYSLDVIGISILSLILSASVVFYFFRQIVKRLWSYTAHEKVE
ncbi:UDP-glucoronosyl and UDP-glucosyl transferase domain-containing protein [Ditylenchus destructor]|uniref:glucuronosyltransferase n=1 Tax=Ditylenchus destructor TaxID=166010 RepID=A0AAD4MLW0_9BILA|nr:UDP-glucoronosyl and UDP-glucosyl transferase domain-containing protein [Ditylenchus destructor]